MKGKGNQWGQGGKNCRSAREQIRALWWQQTRGHFLWHDRCIFGFLKIHVYLSCVSYKCKSELLLSLATWNKIKHIGRCHFMGRMAPVISIRAQPRIAFSICMTALKLFVIIYLTSYKCDFSRTNSWGSNHSRHFGCSGQSHWYCIPTGSIPIKQDCVEMIF